MHKIIVCSLGFKYLTLYSYVLCKDTVPSIGIARSIHACLLYTEEIWVSHEKTDIKVQNFSFHLMVFTPRYFKQCRTQLFDANVFLEGTELGSQMKWACNSNTFLQYVYIQVYACMWLCTVHIWCVQLTMCICGSLYINVSLLPLYSLDYLFSCFLKMLSFFAYLLLYWFVSF